MIAEERVLVLADLDGRTTELGNQDLVTGLDGRGDALAITVEGAGADSEDLSLVELLDGRLGEEDATGSLGLGLDALDKDAVEQGSESLDGLGGDGGLCCCVSPFVSGVTRLLRRRTILAAKLCEGGKFDKRIEVN